MISLRSYGSTAKPDGKASLYSSTTDLPTARRPCGPGFSMVSLKFCRMMFSISAMPSLASSSISIVPLPGWNYYASSMRKCSVKRYLPAFRANACPLFEPLSVINSMRENACSRDSCLTLSSSEGTPPCWCEDAPALFGAAVGSSRMALGPTSTAGNAHTHPQEGHGAIFQLRATAIRTLMLQCLACSWPRQR